MRLLTSSFLGALVVGLVAACGATSADSSTTSSAETEQTDIASLAFIVWTCADVECLNLETNETAKHSYTACSAVREDAQQVGIDICDQRGKRSSSVMSKPATCTPLGTPCPVARAAYHWDDVRKKPVDDGDEVASDAGVDAAPP